MTLNLLMFSLLWIEFSVNLNLQTNKYTEIVHSYSYDSKNNNNNNHLILTFELLLYIFIWRRISEQLFPRNCFFVLFQSLMRVILHGINMVWIFYFWWQSSLKKTKKDFHNREIITIIICSILRRNTKWWQHNKASPYDMRITKSKYKNKDDLIIIYFNDVDGF